MKVKRCGRHRRRWRRWRRQVRHGLQSKDQSNSRRGGAGGHLNTCGGVPVKQIDPSLEDLSIVWPGHLK